MLTQVRIQNFRCFEDHTVPLQQCTIVVGMNNAGKSTLVDALRLVSIVSSRYLALPIKNPPEWGHIPLREVGVSPSLEGMEFNTQNLFHRYGDEPVIVTASFLSGSSLKIYIGQEGKIHAVLFDQAGKVVNSKHQARDEGVLERVEIMPQVAPVERSEVVLNPDYVRRNLSSALAPRHFRNQINYLKEFFPLFCAIVAETWQGLQVIELQGKGSFPGTHLGLLLRNDDFVAEISSMGHGLQMWLQTMWFLARIETNVTVILDEPDVYMHPDLQRRLIRLLRFQPRQIVVTTHSVEIMSEVDPEDILVLDRRLTTSCFAANFPAVQRVLDHFGSAHNLQLAKLWNTKRNLLVEGKDFRLLSDFFDILYPEDQDGLSVIPNMSIGGWTGWQYAIGSSMLLSNSGGESIAVYCILDSDYHTETQIAERKKQAVGAGIRLHIWSRKEIENYLIVPSTITRTIESKIAKRTKPPSLSEVEIEIDKAIELLKDEAFDALANEIWLVDRKLGQVGANKEARNALTKKWTDRNSKLSIVSGKSLFSHIARWSQDQFGVSLNPALIIRSMHPSEVNLEVKNVLTAIARSKEF